MVGMALHVNANFPTSAEFIGQALLTVVCIILVYKGTKYIFGKATTEQSQKHGTLRRRLGSFEALLDLYSKKGNGTGNVSIVISLRSKQSLSHQHVRDALVMLAKRQPMLRAFIRTMENGNRYFEIQKISEILSMIDFSTSDVNASNWKDIWFEQTAKQMRNDLLWRVLVLQEEFVADSDHYANTLMFTLNHSCIDGVSSIKFCEQFLNNLNGVANGTNSVDQEVSSHKLSPYFHDIVIQKRFSHSFLQFLLTYCGLGAILRFCMKPVIFRYLQTKQYNPFYSQFPPSLEVSSFAGPSRLSVKVFTADETKNIIQACRENNCTVTGALTAAAHLAFCQLIEDGLAKDKDIKLQHGVAINARRHCDPKPHEDYIGCFVYLNEEYYLKYNDHDVQFWTVAQEVTRHIQEFVKNAEYIGRETVINKIMKPKDLVELVELVGKLQVRLSGCNRVSSFGSFNLTQRQQLETYKLHESFIIPVTHGFTGTFWHFNHTINGKMTWNITSDVSRVNDNHAEKFANLCFAKFLVIACGRV